MSVSTLEVWDIQMIVAYYPEYRMVSAFFFKSMKIHLKKYHQSSNISRTLIRNKIVDHSDVVGASPVGADPTTSPFST